MDEKSRSTGKRGAVYFATSATRRKRRGNVRRIAAGESRIRSRESGESPCDADRGYRLHRQSVAGGTAEEYTENWQDHAVDPAQPHDFSAAALRKNCRGVANVRHAARAIWTRPRCVSERENRSCGRRRQPEGVGAGAGYADATSKDGRPSR